MLKKNTLKQLAFLIEWHWLFIMKERKRMSRFLDAGYKYSSKRVLALDGHLSYHCNQVSLLEQRYRCLAKTLETNEKNMIHEDLSSYKTSQQE